MGFVVDVYVFVVIVLEVLGAWLVDAVQLWEVLEFVVFIVFRFA